MVQSSLDTYQKIYTKILNFLSYKPRSEKEIINRLKKYSASEEIEQKILQSLETDGYVNDKNIIQMFIQSYLSSPKTKSLISLKQTLVKKGFNNEDIKAALEEVPPQAEEKKVLKDAQKKLRSLGKEPILQKKRKLQDYLYRKGYNPKAIKAVVDSLL